MCESVEVPDINSGSEFLDHPRATNHTLAKWFYSLSISGPRSLLLSQVTYNCKLPLPTSAPPPCSANGKEGQQP